MKKKKPNSPLELFGLIVPKIRLELTHLAAPEPKSGVSTNFTTWAAVWVTLC